MPTKRTRPSTNQHPHKDSGKSYARPSVSHTAHPHAKASPAKRSTPNKKSMPQPKSRPSALQRAKNAKTAAPARKTAAARTKAAAPARGPAKQHAPKRPVQKPMNNVVAHNFSGTVWTKESPSRKGTDKTPKKGKTSSSRKSGSTQGIFGAILAVLGAAFATIGHALALFGRTIVNLCHRSRVALVVIVSIAVLAMGGIYDNIAYANKIYGGVSIGGIDVGGMTVAEAQNAVAQKYGTRLGNGNITLYASQEAMDSHAVNQAITDEESVEEAAAKTVSWTTNSTDLQAYIDYASVGESAMLIGRDSIGDRLSLFFAPKSVDVAVNYNQASIEALANSVDATLGTTMINYGIQVNNGVATTTLGSDGNMVNRDTLKQALTRLLLSDESTAREFVAKVEYTPVKINADAAQQTAGKVNDAIEHGATFICGAALWTADAATLGNWVQTTIVSSSGGGYMLQPSFSAATAKAEILTHIQATFQDNTGHITFTNDNGAITVHLQDSSGTMPLVSDAIASLNKAVFGNGGSESSVVSTATSTPTITIETTDIPSSLTFDEALSYGVISEISSYTTQYTSGAVARNTNIHLAADLLNNSIVSADNGSWSFNDIAGECNAEKGFQSAGAIIDDETVDEIGGGICQVATTIFNSVYNAGYPVTSRTNHSLYISSYPAGRDAAISWPAPDLKWENDGTSDVLLRMTYTDTSVTATLYGISPGYQVSTVVGNWETGDKYKTVYKYDSSLSKGNTYTKTNGTDGRKITVTRTVTDSAGSVLHTDAFVSVYEAQNEVIVRGGSAADYS